MSGDITDEMVQGQIDLALMEDIGQGDITTLACITKETVIADMAVVGLSGETAKKLIKQVLTEMLEVDDEL